MADKIDVIFVKQTNEKRKNVQKKIGAELRPSFCVMADSSDTHSLWHIQGKIAIII